MSRTAGFLGFLDDGAHRQLLRAGTNAARPLSVTIGNLKNLHNGLELRK
jgi:hypothetical protein